MKRHARGSFAAGIKAYCNLLDAVGLDIEPDALAGHLAQDDGEPREALVEAIERTAKNGRCRKKIPADVTDRMDAMVADLVEKLIEAAPELAEEAEDARPDVLAELLRQRGEVGRDSAADAIALNGHRHLLRDRYIPAAQFRDLLARRKDAGRLATWRLVPYLREEMGKRGYQIEEETVRRALDGGPDEEPLPYCIKQIMRGVNGEFRRGLMPLEDLVGETDPDEWLERVRVQLKFRSHSAMHRAIAERTGLKYDCVHKSLSGEQKAKRIQAEIKYCFDEWLGVLEAGEDPGIDDDYLGVPVEETCALLPELERRFATKEQIYRTIAERTGIKSGSVRRYFQDCGQLKYAPLAVFRCAQELARGPVVARVERGRRRKGSSCRRRRSARPISYLADGRTRRVAAELSARLKALLAEWRQEGDDPEREYAFHELRRTLIMAMREPDSYAALGA